MSSKFPLVVLLAELACQMRQRGMELSLTWAPREQNEEADALANEDFTAFDPGRRVVVDLQKIKWLVLDDMLAVSENIYEEVRRQREAKPRSVGSLQKAKGDPSGRGTLGEARAGGAGHGLGKLLARGGIAVRCVCAVEKEKQKHTKQSEK